MPGKLDTQALGVTDFRLVRLSDDNIQWLFSELVQFDLSLTHHNKCLLLSCIETELAMYFAERDLKAKNKSKVVKNSLQQVASKFDEALSDLQQLPGFASEILKEELPKPYRATLTDLEGIQLALWRATFNSEDYIRRGPSSDSGKIVLAARLLIKLNELFKVPVTNTRDGIAYSFLSVVFQMAEISKDGAVHKVLAEAVKRVKNEIPPN